ncbi:MAG: class I tRNA ligase family protein, partial [Coriobacteriales bacterium]|nr:class I tRNA ligase family protein [Coriobacteriales bacterium]
MSNDYKSSMNLPVTDFPMRAGLAKSEPERLKKWYEMDLYQQILKVNEGNESYVLHDGPPYANGPIHIGHAFNKILKDIIVKYHSGRGYYSPYVPGWDCHGQPIEHVVETNLGPEKMAAIDKSTLRRLCREWATKHINIQREGFKRLGVIGDWDDPYLTYVPSYEAGIVQIFKMMYEKGAIYQGRKPIHWCYRCHTALAEAEIEYSDETSPSAYVAFAFTEAANADLQKCFQSELPFSVLIWTTTPWTLPANTGVSLNPNAEYVAVVDPGVVAGTGGASGASGAAEVVGKAGATGNTSGTAGRVLIMARELLPAVAEVAGWDAPQLLSDSSGNPLTCKGSELQGLRYHHPILDDMTGQVITGDHVTLDTGTGAVHTAPGHG